MAADKLQYAIGNSASTTSSSSITNSATSLPLTSDTNFASKSGEGMVVIDEGNAGEEYAYATTKSGSSLTIPLANRGLEGSSAAAHDSGVTVKGILSATMWNNLIDAMSNVVLKTTGAVDNTKVPAVSGGYATTLTTTAATNVTLPTTGTVATIAGSETFTNKTLTNPVINYTDTTLTHNVKVRAYPSGNQENLANTVWTEVVLDTESYDVGNDFASNTFTAPVTGYYLVMAQVTFTNVVADKSYGAGIFTGAGVAIETSYGHASLATYLTVRCGGVFKLTATDTIEMEAQSNSGNNEVDILGGSSWTYLDIVLLTL